MGFTEVSYSRRLLKPSPLFDLVFAPVSTQDKHILKSQVDVTLI